jgi:transposase, IS5 family
MEGQHKIWQLQLFAPQTGLTPGYIKFMSSELGQLWQKIPFDALSAQIEKSVLQQGAHIPSWGWFSIKSGIAAQVLKSYYNGISDKKLLDKINIHKEVQWFCFCSLGESEVIKDKNLLWRWREFIGRYLAVDSLNVVQIMAWKESLEHPHFRMTDATAYEVKIAYPTDVKLLWSACEWVYELMPILSKRLGLPSPKPLYRHYEEQRPRQRQYEKSRRKTHVQTQSRKRQLLYWLDKGIELLKPLWDTYQKAYEVRLMSGLLRLKPQQIKRFETIQRLNDQQKALFDDPNADVGGRIVSLQQSHIRPIVRGKELKKVEFGPKVNMLRVGSINLIEKYSFDNFNEGTCFQSAATIYSELTGECHQMGADGIYATNANRKFATKNNIATCFKNKGRLPTNEDKKKEKIKSAQTIHILRATHMEGSFGNEKEHYDLAKIKSKTPDTQKACLFCAILTANAMTLITKEKAKLKFKTKPPPKVA